MTYKGKHRADGGEGYSVHGRGNHGASDGHKPTTERESDLAPFDQATADRMAADHERRQSGK